MYIIESMKIIYFNTLKIDPQFTHRNQKSTQKQTNFPKPDIYKETTIRLIKHGPRIAASSVTKTTPEASVTVSRTPAANDPSRTTSANYYGMVESAILRNDVILPIMFHCIAGSWRWWVAIRKCNTGNADESLISKLYTGGFWNIL